MLPIIAAIPSIIGAISKVTELFSAGKKTVETVTGKPSKASTPEELQDEIASLPQDQQAKWAQVMQQKVDLFKAENERLAIEIGIVDSNITSKLSEEAADKIALMRQTTRPWAVRMMVHYVFLPFYLIIIDVFQELFYAWILKGIFKVKASPVFKTFDYVFGAFGPEELSKLGTLDKIAELFKDPMSHTMMASLYAQVVPWATSIIISYMGLREIGKAKGTSGDLGATIKSAGASAGKILTQTISTGADLVSKVKNIFKK